MKRTYRYEPGRGVVEIDPGNYWATWSWDDPMGTLYVTDEVRESVDVPAADVPQEREEENP